MSGLRRLCKLYASMTVIGGGKKVRYVWDYSSDKPRMVPVGSKRYEVSMEALRRKISEG